MNAICKRILTTIATTALAGSIGPLAASAQGTPSYSRPGPEEIHGTIAAINGKYNISVHDERGYVDNVSLHDGTIINPTGLTLSPGQSVTIAGHAAGSTFVADEIDTPYSTYGYPYPYAAYPYPYSYPAFGFGLRFGGPRFGGPRFGFRGRFR